MVAAATQWQTINPAHAVQRASAIITFSEKITAYLVKRIADALRSHAHAMGLLKEEQLNSLLFQIQPGGVSQAQAPKQEGVSFQKLHGDNVVQSISITTEAIRFDSFAYTRWVGFQEQVLPVLTGSLPLIEQASQVSAVALEYVDFFYAADEGAPDAQQIIDRQSDLIAKKSFSRRAQFHSHCGWFEQQTEVGQRLVNVDVSVADANGPVGLRRAINIRTFESEQVTDLTAPLAAKFMTPDGVLSTLETLHASLKKRLRSVLTRDAAAMISLGN